MEEKISELEAYIVRLHAKLCLIQISLQGIKDAMRWQEAEAKHDPTQTKESPVVELNRITSVSNINMILESIESLNIGKN